MTSEIEPFCLPERVNISVVAELYQGLTAELERQGEVVIDAAGVERIDAAGVQLLAAFAAEAQRRSVPLRWQAPSAALYKSAQLLGLDSHLALSENALAP